MDNLTPKQKQVLDYLTEFISEHGYSPTLEQIRKRFRLRALSTIHKHITNLHRKGWITREKRTRGFSIIHRTPEVRQSRLIPVTGDVAPDGTLCENAGGPSTIDVPAALAPGEQSFALRIVGNPLPGSGLQDGDFLIAHETDHATDSEMFIAKVDGRTRLTRRAANPDRATGAVRTVVTGMLRTYEASARYGSSREFQRPRQDDSIRSTRDAASQPTSTVPASRGGQSSASTTTA